MADKYIEFTYNTPASAVGTPKQITATITAISQAASAVVTAANDFSISDVVTFASVAGMTQINGLAGTISAANATTFTVGINSTAFTAYSSGGVATKLMDTAQLRVLYDDAIDKQSLYMAAQRFREWAATRLGN